MAKAKKKAGVGTQTFDEFVSRKPELTVLTDHPLRAAEAFKADTFNFRFKLGPVYDILRHPGTKAPAAILVTGGWGTGKTSAMRWLQGLLEEWNKQAVGEDIKVRPIWFYPWKYDNKNDVRRGLIAEVIINAVYIRNPENRKIIISSKKILTGLKLLGSFGLNVVGDLVSASEFEIPVIPGLKISSEALKEIRGHFNEAAHPEAAFLNELEEAMKYWVRESLGKNQRTVIFIDDLDRCMPDIALQVLEALKLYLNIPNLMFVVGVDKQVIENLVVEDCTKLGLVKKKDKGDSEDDEKKSKKDEDKARQYLSKMFQVEIEVSPDEKQIEDFFVEQLKDITYWNEPYLSPDEQKLFRDLVLKFANRSGPNPREVKRLLNSALIMGAGAVLIKKDGLKFNQGLQLFFVRKILDERYTMASEAGSNRGVEFFTQWSKIVCEGKKKDPDFPTTVEVPPDFGKKPEKELDLEEKTQRRLDNVFAPFAPEEYHELLKNPKFSGLLKLLADEDLGRLMQIPYPDETAEVSAVVGTSKEADIVREAVARLLKKKPEELTDDDYHRTRRLDLSGSSISDLSPLTQLTGLEILFLGGTQITDISILKNLMNLKWLSLRETQVKDIAVLSGLTMLQDLNLFGSLVSDISSLSSLTRLQELSLARTQVNDISVLTSLTKLQRLFLGGIKIGDIGVLSVLTNLREIDLSDTQVTNIGPLASLVDLRILNLCQTQVSDITVLAGLKNLEELYISDTRIHDLDPLSNLTNLQVLALYGTTVSDAQVTELMDALPMVRVKR